MHPPPAKTTPRRAALSLIVCLAAALAGAGSAVAPQRLNLAGWRSTLDETFSATSNGVPGVPGMWRTTFHNAPPDAINARTLPTNAELQVYVDSAFRGLGLDPFRMEGRRGVGITADRAPAAAAEKLEGFRYTSGLLTTHDSFKQRYGYFEVTAQIPHGRGLWPAIWLLPADGSWPPEIDIMENLGQDTRTYFGTLHSRTREKDPHVFHQAVDLAQKPHAYGVLWGPRRTVWYLDRREQGRAPTSPDMDGPAYLLINLAVGGYWPGPPDATTRFPAEMKVSGVRVFAPPPGWSG